MYYVYTLGCMWVQPVLQDIAQVSLELFRNQAATNDHLKSMLDGIITDCVDESRPLLMLGNTFQKRKVSSPAPVTILCPHGLMERYSTRWWCPVKVWTFYMLGYFQRIIWFNEYPCVLTISCVVLENIRLQTWEPVSTAWSGCRVCVFQNLMCLSAVPPPVANKPFWWGDQPIALTAAVWSWNLASGRLDCKFQIISLLSFPPDASCWSSKDHFKPQTSCLCPTSLLKWLPGALKSLCKILRSLLPVLTRDLLQAIELTLPRWPCKSLTFLH